MLGSSVRPLGARRLVRAGALIGLLALLTAGGVVLWEWRHPTAFAPAQQAIGSSLRTLEVGEPFYVAVTYGAEDVDVVLRGAAPVLRPSSADADVTYVVCERAASAQGTIGSAYEEATARHCERLVLLGGDPVRYAPAEDQVLMRVVPREPGSVVVRATRLTYEDGWRSGSQLVGEGFRIREVVRAGGR